MVPRKLIFASFISYICMLIMTVSSIQWANYVDRRSNQRWCNIVKLIDDGNAANPPPTKREQDFAIEIRILRENFDC